MWTTRSARQDNVELRFVALGVAWEGRRADVIDHSKAPVGDRETRWEIDRTVDLVNGFAPRSSLSFHESYG